MLATLASDSAVAPVPETVRRTTCFAVSAASLPLLGDVTASVPGATAACATVGWKRTRADAAAALRETAAAKDLPRLERTKDIRCGPLRCSGGPFLAGRTIHVTHST